MKDHVEVKVDLDGLVLNGCRPEAIAMNGLERLLIKAFACASNDLYSFGDAAYRDDKVGSCFFLVNSHGMLTYRTLWLYLLNQHWRFDYSPIGQAFRLMLLSGVRSC